MKRIGFNDGWRFRRQEEPEECFRSVVLPHDAMIGEERGPKAPGGSGSGYFPGGAYVYEKAFDVPAEWQGGAVLLAFDGVYQDAAVTVNGRPAGGRPYGYVPFEVDLSPHLAYGAENTVRVAVDNTAQPNSRWYSGAGIHRQVHLLVGGRKRIIPHGVRVTTLSIDPPRLLVETKTTGGRIAFEIRDGEHVVAKGYGPRAEVDLPHATLWSDETPHLYRCHVVLTDDGARVDEETADFGVRLLTWGPKGFFVNGKETKLRGGCVHHDHGLLGARSFPESEERRVRIMKAQGFNAIRSAHNPASEAMLDACDRLGMYVMDELWDMWYVHKTPHDYAARFEAEWREDLRATVARDYNHPSVVMHSIGNENGEPCDARGVAMARELVDAVHALDATRPVTAGSNLMILLMMSRGRNIFQQMGPPEGGEGKPARKRRLDIGSTLFNLLVTKMGKRMLGQSATAAADRVTSPFLDALDIAGYNYATPRYVKDGTLHPGRTIVGSETFPQDIAVNWAHVERLPYLIGDFMWTAWDYLGEAGIGHWSYEKEDSGFMKPYPMLTADAGAIDLLGRPGAEAAFASTVWKRRTEPYLGVRPANRPGRRPYGSMWRGTNAIDSWSWRKCVGNRTTVEVYADGHKAELRLDGRRIGRRRIRMYKALFPVRYAPGTLEAIVYDARGAEIGRTALVSATGVVQVALRPECDSVRPGGLVHVDVALVGVNGVVEANADTKVSVTVEGGELLGFGSANPRTAERYGDGTFTTYYGRAQAIVRAGSSGPVVVCATGSGLGAATVEIANESAP